MQTGQEISHLKGANAGAPQPMSPQLATALAIACNALSVDGRLSAAACPAAARAALAARHAELSHALAPAPIDRIRAIVAALASMPTREEADPAKRRLLFEQYLAICSDVPEWALRAAVQAFLSHEAGTAFRPTCGALRAYALRRAEPYLAEQRRLRAALAAPIAPAGKPIDAARRKQLADMLRAAVREDPAA